MWYTILLTLVIDVGGLLLLYALLRDRIRRATSAAAQIAELRDEVSRLVAELNQTTERNVAVLEDRIAGLTELLAAADRKIGLLRRENEKHDVGVQVYNRLAEGKAAGAVEAPRGDRRRPRAAEPEPPLAVELSQPLPPGAGEAHGADTARAGSREPAPSAGGGGLGREEVHRRVMMLSRSGFSPSLIAARVGVPLGEVELIISLERQRISQEAPALGDGER